MHIKLTYSDCLCMELEGKMDYKGQGETLGGDENIYLDYGDGFRSVYLCQNSLN